MAKSKTKKVVSKKKAISPRKATKKAVKKVAQKKLAVRKNQVPTPKAPVAKTLSENAFTLKLFTGGKEYVTKTETIQEAIIELKEMIPSIMLIKTFGDMVITQNGRSTNFRFNVFPLKRLIYGHGPVGMEIFAKRVSLALK